MVKNIFYNCCILLILIIAVTSCNRELKNEIAKIQREIDSLTLEVEKNKANYLIIDDTSTFQNNRHYYEPLNDFQFYWQEMNFE